MEDIIADLNKIREQVKDVEAIIEDDFDITNIEIGISDIVDYIDNLINKLKKGVD